MTKALLKSISLIFFLGACATTSRNTKPVVNNQITPVIDTSLQLVTSDDKPKSLMDLPQTQDGGFVLSPGYYEAEFKTYCLQPGTPDPIPGDAYLQSPITGYRSDIVESVLLNSREKPGIEQRNVQLLLWSIVSGSDYNKLTPSVKADAARLLTPKQIFKLKGGVMGIIKTVSYSSGLLNTNSKMKNMFDMGVNSYEAYEKLAVLKETPKVLRPDVKYDQWYKEDENFYVRYFPASYQKVKIQVYVPDNLLDKNGKRNGEYVVFDPTGLQATPAITNSQRLGIGAPVVQIIRDIIIISKKTDGPKNTPDKTEKPAPPVKQW